MRRAVLLTGGTGLLGRFLLGELLSQGVPVVALVRDSKRQSALERGRSLRDWCHEHFGRSSPAPLVMAGDLHLANLGLSLVDRVWLGRHCSSVVHAAASLSFREQPNREPWLTNVDGTARLLHLAASIGLTDWRQISTAFVCGRRSGLIHENPNDDTAGFNNPYEESKHLSEKLVRANTALKNAIYRPSIIVGDSRTGYSCSYAGIYRFFELALRLANDPNARGERHFPLRVPFSGAEPWNLVPVDWVARSIVALMRRPTGQSIFHLTSTTPTSARLVHDVAAQELKIGGVQFLGHELPGPLNRVEELFLAGIDEYRPYFVGNPQFVATNTRSALPCLPAPEVDEPLLRRLIRFAVRDNWGRARRQLSNPSSSGCRHYFENVFAPLARRSRLARQLDLTISVRIVISGHESGAWDLCWSDGELHHVRASAGGPVDVVYRTDLETFKEVTTGQLSPQEAFFQQRVEIDGDMELALKLVHLLTHLLAEASAASETQTEAAHH